MTTQERFSEIFGSLRAVHTQHKDGSQSLLPETLLFGFIEEEKALAVQKREEELREKIAELGHQQDDDTIWCNMDEVLALLPVPSEVTE